MGGWFPVDFGGDEGGQRRFKSVSLGFGLLTTVSLLMKLNYSGDSLILPVEKQWTNLQCGGKDMMTRK